MYSKPENQFLTPFCPYVLANKHNKLRWCFYSLSQTFCHIGYIFRYSEFVNCLHYSVCTIRPFYLLETLQKSEIIVEKNYTMMFVSATTVRV